jgi:hypothetical protein
VKNFLNNEQKSEISPTNCLLTAMKARIVKSVNHMTALQYFYGFSRTDVD